MTDPAAPATVRQWIASPPAWVEVREVAEPTHFVNLHRGEQEAVTLALSLKADLILMDEKRGRAVAQDQGLTVTGTLGVLAQAADHDLLSLPDAIARLKQTSYQISERLIQTALERAALRAQEWNKAIDPGPETAVEPSSESEPGAEDPQSP